MLQHTIYFSSREGGRGAREGERERAMWGGVGGKLGLGHIGYNVRSLIFILFKGIYAIGSVETPGLRGGFITFLTSKSKALGKYKI